MRIGVDLGGTKIEAIALDDQGNRLLQQRVSTPAGDYKATIRAVTRLVSSIEKKAGIRGSIGIGTPGSTSPTTGMMRNANSTCLNGKPLQHDLEQLLKRPIRMANDADCFALSEATDGAGADCESVFGVIIGTGTGAGIVLNGQLILGANRIAGEWGHNPLPWPNEEETPGSDCYCGKQGCIETFLSGPGLSDDYEKEAGIRISGQAVADRLLHHEQAAERVITRYEDRLARSLATVINILDPEIIVLGGGLSNFNRIYNNIPAIWTRYIFSDAVRTRLLPPIHGDSSGVRGAAWLWGSGESKDY